MLDEELEPQLNEQVRKLAAEVPGVEFIEKCYIRKMGLKSHADMHVWVNKNLTVEQGHTIAHAVEDHIQEQLPQFAIINIHVEPAGVVH